MQTLSYGGNYGDMVAARFKKTGRLVVDMTHACVGIAGEVGELLDALKKVWVYNKPINMASLMEEFGDILFYIEAASQLMGKPPEWEHVIFTRKPEPLSKNAKALTDEERNICRVSLLYSFSANLLSNVMANMLTRSSNEKDYIGSGRNALMFQESFDWMLIELAGFIPLFGFTFAQVLEANHAKLDKRYPEGGYTDAQAQARADKVMSQVSDAAADDGRLHSEADAIEAALVPSPHKDEAES